MRDGLPDRHVACRCGESPGVARIRDVGWRSHGRAVVPARILLARRDAESIAAHSLGLQQRGVGAVAGGPVGAAVGAAANAVLAKPLGELGAKTYRVSGPWKDPKVEVIGREPARRQDEAGKPPQPSP